MAATMTQQEVFTKVRAVLVDALGVDEEEVTPTAKLEADLGAESIDYLDIVFRLEKTFGIKINQGELFPEQVLNDPKYVVEGKLTVQGMAELKQRLPHMDLSGFESSRKVSEFSSVFTVQDIVRFVESKLG